MPHAPQSQPVTHALAAHCAVDRKLWAKMMEGDHRTALKALYILHRLSANGAAEHAMHLQSRWALIANRVLLHHALIPYTP